jgi:hypothetical protein
MNTRPSDGPDPPEADDPVMLAVLANRGRESRALSPDEERLLDDWVAGQLAPDDAARAEAIVKQNALAAERVLERRLQAAAAKDPPIPQAITARLLQAAAPPKASAMGAWWRSLGRRQWMGIAGAAALASILVVAGLPVLQQMMSGSPLQVAMVTINDRGPLFEASDLRMRGTTPGPASDQRFRDVEIPTGVLKDLVAPGQPKDAVSREIERYVLGTGETTARPVRVIVDSALKQRLETADRDRTLVRVYDLNDPRAADVRNLVGAPRDDNGRTFLLTVKP